MLKNQTAEEHISCATSCVGKKGIFKNTYNLPIQRNMGSGLTEGSRKRVERDTGESFTFLNISFYIVQTTKLKQKQVREKSLKTTSELKN